MYFDNSSRTFIIESTDTSLVGNIYKILVYGYVPDGTYATTSFTITIL